jgi:hypothetical protein
MDSEKETPETFNKKLLLLFATITAVITTLLASIVVLLEWHWSIALGIGLLVGITMSRAHNWLVEKLAFKYKFDVAPNPLERLFKPEPKPRTDLIVYVEPEPYKDPWIHKDNPEDFK